jgi:hypothetical protein
VRPSAMRLPRPPAEPTRGNMTRTYVIPIAQSYDSLDELTKERERAFEICSARVVELGERAVAIGRTCQRTDH